MNIWVMLKNFLGLHKSELKDLEKRILNQELLMKSHWKYLCKHLPQLYQLITNLGNSHNIMNNAQNYHDNAINFMLFSGRWHETEKDNANENFKHDISKIDFEQQNMLLKKMVPYAFCVWKELQKNRRELLFDKNR